MPRILPIASFVDPCSVWLLHYVLDNFDTDSGHCRAAIRPHRRLPEVNGISVVCVNGACIDFLPTDVWDKSPSRLRQRSYSIEPMHLRDRVLLRRFSVLVVEGESHTKDDNYLGSSSQRWKQALQGLHGPPSWNKISCDHVSTSLPSSFFRPTELLL